MKKILLALTLCLALCLSLLGCGAKKTGADYLFDSLDNLSASVQNQKLNKFAAGMEAGTEVTFGIANADSLISVIGEGISGLPSFGNVSLSSKVKEEAKAVELALTMNDKMYALSLIGNGDGFVLSTDMLSRNYGISAEEIQRLLAGDVPAEALEAVGKAGNAAALGAAVQRYTDLLETALREKVEFVLIENGKNVLINFTLTPAETADVCAVLYDTAKDDSFVKEMLESFGEDTDALFAKSAEDVRTEIADSLTDAGFTANFAAEVVKKGEHLIALNGDFTMNGETVQFGISSTETGMHFVGEHGEDKLEMSVSAGNELFDLDVATAVDGETSVLQITFEKGVGSYNISVDDSFDFTADLTYTLTDDALDMKIGSVTYGSLTYDLAEAGVTLHIGSAFTMPEMPAEYTSVADFGEADWQAVVTDLLTKNPELLSMLLGMIQ